MEKEHCAITKVRKQEREPPSKGENARSAKFFLQDFFCKTIFAEKKTLFHKMTCLRKHDPVIFSEKWDFSRKPFQILEIFTMYVVCT